MTNWRARAVAWIIFCMLSPSAVAGSVPQSLARRHVRAVRDEPDPTDTRACYSLGQLEIAFSTEKKGPPTVGMVVTDPRGRRIGFDPIKKNGWQELPEAEAFIDCDEPGTEGSCHGLIQVCGPVSGTYKLEVIGTDTGDYSLHVTGFSQAVKDDRGLRSADSHTAVTAVPIQKGSRDKLLLNYSRDPAFKVAFRSEQTAPVAGNE
jgi:hypothetical protein